MQPFERSGSSGMPIHYNSLLVLISFAIAAMASYTALDLARQVTRARARGSNPYYWLVGGALSMGTGIWSMHFVGMLALMLPFPSMYDATATVMSLLIAIVISGFALWTISQPTVAVRALIRSALLLGAGISGMHYLGTAALNLNIPIKYDPLIVCLSIAVACAASLGALWLAFRLRDSEGWLATLPRVGSALLMGMAIAGMHYTGMAAASIDAAAICVGGVPVDGPSFAVTLSLATGVVLASTLIVLSVNSNLQSHQGRFLEKLRKANSLLRELDELRSKELEDLYENAPCGYHSIDQFGVIQKMNGTALRWLGYPAGEVIGVLSLESLISPSQRQKALSRFADFKGGNALMNEEFEFVRKDGTTFWVSVNATAVLNEQGEYVSSRSSVFDITARKNAEQALRRTTAFLDSVIDSIPIALFVKNARTHRYVRMNRAGAELVGIEASRMLGRTPDELFAPELAQVHAEFDRQILEKNGLIYFGACETPIRPGVSQLLETTKTVIPDEEGQPLYVLGMTTDVTESRRINAELERKTKEADDANRAKSSFLAAMSHEIRTPMNGVIGMIEVLDQTHLAAEQKDMIQGIRSSSMSLLAIIDDILDFSKIEAGRLELELVPTSVADVLEAAAESLSILAEAGDVDIRLYCDPDIPATVMSDPTRLRQIALNLGSNAIKFSQRVGGRRGRVVIRADLLRADEAEAMVRLSVIDNGIGISPEARTGLFRPFVQAGSSTTRRFGGTGLGLTICQHIAHAMCSEVSVLSEEGSGSTFSMEIRFDVGASEGPVRDHGSCEQANTLLIGIGVDADLQEVFSSYLRGQNVDIAWFDSFAAATADVDQARSRSRHDRVVVAQPLNPDWLERTVPLEQRVRESMGVQSVSRLLLVPGHKAAASVDFGDASSLDCNVMRRSAVIQAVVASAGAGFAVAVATVEQSASGPVLSIEEAESNGTLILVAEDHPNNRKVLSHQLRILGCTAEMAVDGQQAFDMWKSRRYGLILTDCHMPEMDGFGLTAAIRAIEKVTGEHTPIIAVTANAMKGEAERCVREGMDDYLCKPLLLAQLKRALDRWLVRSEPALPVLYVDTDIEDAGAASTYPVSAAALPAALGTSDPKVLKAFYTDFLASAADTIAQMTHAGTVGAWADVRGASHRLKSSAATVGAQALARACDALEAGCAALETGSAPIKEPSLLRQIDMVEGRFEDARQWLVAETAH